MEFTFLQPAGTQRLVKHFSTEGNRSYPMVKKVHSHHFPCQHTGIEALQYFDHVLRVQAREGHALMKGPFIRPVVNESRAQLSDSAAPTKLLVLDIDGFDLTKINYVMDWSQPGELQRLADTIVALLPPEFQGVSYIAQASASLGMKENEASLHLFFLLSRAITPPTLKTYLRSLNLESPQMREQLNLSTTGAALHLCVDATLADNSRVIYIGPPTFEGIENPFPNDEDRIIMVEKPYHSINLTQAVSRWVQSDVDKEFNKTIRRLRREKGLNFKREKTTNLHLSGKTQRVITNPDALDIQLVRDETNFLRVNINGGDSNGYYINKRNPAIVHNFKGEMPFLLKKANPEFYAEVRRMLGMPEEAPNQAPTDRVGGEHGLVPFAFRDTLTNDMHAGLLTPEQDGIMQVGPITKGNVKNFFKFNNSVPPDPLPEYEYIFDPTTAVEIDRDQCFINQFVATDYLKAELVSVSEEAPHLGTGLPHLRLMAPTIAKIIHSVVGSSDSEAEYFLNWLAYIIQERRKPQTAWILSGTHGTGKGLLFDHVMTPILGSRYCSTKTVDNMIDQFNDWVGNQLLVMVNEFNLSDSRDGNKLSNILKTMITEEHMTARAMRTRQRTIMSYFALLFCTNEEAATKIPEQDRRFHVAPRQTQSLRERHPEMFANNDLIAAINNELDAFAMFMRNFEVTVEDVRNVRETAAKQELREAAMNTVDRFCIAVRDGDLDYFLDYVQEDAVSQTEHEYKNQFDRIVKRLLTDVSGYQDIPEDGSFRTMSFISTTELRVLYCRVMGKVIGPEALGKMWKLHHVDIKQYRPAAGARRQRGYRQRWATRVSDVQGLVDSILTEADLQANNLAAPTLN